MTSSYFPFFLPMLDLQIAQADDLDFPLACTLLTQRSSFLGIRNSFTVVISNASSQWCLSKYTKTQAHRHTNQHPPPCGRSSSVQWQGASVSSFYVLTWHSC